MGPGTQSRTAPRHDRNLLDGYHYKLENVDRGDFFNGTFLRLHGISSVLTLVTGSLQRMAPAKSSDVSYRNGRSENPVL